MHARYSHPHIIWSATRSIRYMALLLATTLSAPAHVHLMCTCTRTYLVVYTMGGRLCTEWIPARPGPRLAWPSRGTVTRETRGSRPHRPHPQTFPPSCSPDLSTTTAAFMSMFVLVLTALDRTIHATPIDLFWPQHICLLLIYLPLPFPTAAFPTSAPPAPAHMPHHSLQFLQCKRALRPTARFYPFKA